jgi:hypothetical protein
MVFGLALVLALMFGVASMALGATGGNFILGKANSAGALSKLTANIANPALSLINTSTGAGASALNLQVAPTKPPLKVNSSQKVANLNADKVDGHDAPMWAVVNANGSIPNSSDPGILSFQQTLVGTYEIQFPKDISQCAYSATLSSGGFDIVNVFNDAPQKVLVTIVKPGSEDGTAHGFYLVVNC